MLSYHGTQPLLWGFLAFTPSSYENRNSPSLHSCCSLQAAAKARSSHLNHSRKYWLSQLTAGRTFYNRTSSAPVASPLNYSSMPSQTKNKSKKGLRSNKPWYDILIGDIFQHLPTYIEIHLITANSSLFRWLSESNLELQAHSSFGYGEVGIRTH